MRLSLDTAYRSFGGEVEASSTPTICRLPDSRRHQLWAIARPYCLETSPRIDRGRDCEASRRHPSSRSTWLCQDIRLVRKRCPEDALVCSGVIGSSKMASANDSFWHFSDLTAPASDVRS